MVRATLNNSSISPRHYQLGKTCAWMLLAVLSFHEAQSKGVGLLMVPCSYAMLQLSLCDSWRYVFYPLLLTGLLFYSPQLRFFSVIFGSGAGVLWLLLAVWLPLFGLVIHFSSRRLNPVWSLILAPVVWTGLEYFRSEVYALRFTWLTLGNSFWSTPSTARGIGVYGLSFGCLLIAALLLLGVKQRKLAPVTLGLAVLFWLCWLTYGNGLQRAPERSPQIPSLQVAGLQLEFPSESTLIAGLNHLIETHPQTQLVMLSEYSFAGPIPTSVRRWCKRHQLYVVAGGTKPLGGTKYYNMAYVIGPTGNIEFEQAKSRPIQFFKDGLPAPQRRIWHSPWGAIGILICFDLSYAQVTDDFVKQGARLLLVPTMDVRGWGRQEHELNRRTAPLRAAEYGIPIFRLCSSGVSQVVDQRGVVTASAPFPGQGELIYGTVPMNATPRLPVDRFLSPLCVVITWLLCLGLIIDGALRRWKKGII